MTQLYFSSFHSISEFPLSRKGKKKKNCWVLARPRICNLKPFMCSAQGHMMIFIASETTAAFPLQWRLKAFVTFSWNGLMIARGKVQQKSMTGFHLCSTKSHSAALSVICQASFCRLSWRVIIIRSLQTYVNNTKPRTVIWLHIARSSLCPYLQLVICGESVELQDSVDHKHPFEWAVFNFLTLPIMHGHNRQQEIIFFCCVVVSERGRIRWMIIKCHTLRRARSFFFPGIAADWLWNNSNRHQRRFCDG